MPEQRKVFPLKLTKQNVESVISFATKNAENMTSFFSGSALSIIETIRAAACFHDLGKLDEENQKVLQTSSKKGLPLQHWDAGSAKLLSLNHIEAALFVYVHHTGLCSIFFEAQKEKHFLRVSEIAEEIQQKLSSYVDCHSKFVETSLGQQDRKKSGWNGLTRRLALSCLVDADHGDTARNFKKEVKSKETPPRWEERLKSLDQFVDELFKNDPNSPRNILRQKIYQHCRNANSQGTLLGCDSPVGTGKTTAIMAHLLKTAIEKKLRHVFVILPFTNIIKQSVDVYRKALVLPGENPEEIIAEHHHQADFTEIESRQLATLWNAPIIVTTAVQFFETLGSNHPGRLRKLHELPGSGIFVDEVHAAVPSFLWPQTWLWVKDLSQNWGCFFVLASGSLPRFWQLPQFADPPESIPDLIPASLKIESFEKETQRINYSKNDHPLNRLELVNFILSKKGPRLVILNTVQSAAVMARELLNFGHSTIHLSTALTPRDRGKIVPRISERLAKKRDQNWTLVATSCVEAGMDFSFNVAFRESCSASSLIQIGGRVNRHGKEHCCEIWDFCVQDPLLNFHPAFETSRVILNSLFEENFFATKTPTDLITEAMRREVMSEFDKRAGLLKELERKCDYPEVAKLCRVINSDTRLVVVSKEIIKALENFEKVSSVELIQNSVQLWFQKLRSLAIEKIQGHEEIYKWNLGYDAKFLGYMEGLLPLIEADKEGFLVF